MGNTRRRYPPDFNPEVVEAAEQRVREMYAVALSLPPPPDESEPQRNLRMYFAEKMVAALRRDRDRRLGYAADKRQEISEW